MRDAEAGLLMKPPDGAVYRFDPGALCLELLCTGGPGAPMCYEILHKPRDLALWLRECRLGLDPGRVRIGTAELASARRLRDALWRLVRERAYGNVTRLGRPAGAPARADRSAGAGDRGSATGPFEPADLAVVNESACAPPLVPKIGPDGTYTWALPATGSQVVSTFARDAVELLTGPRADRIRECAAHDCALVFADTSRPGLRRWCAMERCGNRRKVRALRARRDPASGGATKAPARDGGAPPRDTGAAAPDPDTRIREEAAPHGGSGSPVEATGTGAAASAPPARETGAPPRDTDVPTATGQ